MIRIALAGLTGALLLPAAFGCSAAATSQAPEVQQAPVTPVAIRAAGKHKGDYLPAHNWKIEIDGVIAGGFKEVSGLESEVEVIEYRNGDDPITHKRPGKAKYKNIVLKRGFVADDGLEAWFTPEGQAPAARKSGSIIYLDREGQEVLRFSFHEAWPSVARPAKEGERAKVMLDRDTGIAVVQEVTLVGEIELKTRHDTAKNAIGNIR